MISHPLPLSILVLFTAALAADAALGQSLSIIRKGESELLIEAAAPPDTRYVLQESGNCHLWQDVNDDVRGQLSYRVEGTKVTKRFFRLTPWTPPGPPIRLALIGDSTVAGENGWGSGWGKGMHGYFKPTVQIVNLAWPNMSTATFLASEQKPKLVAIRPDFVLVQFGWVDWGGCNGDTICTTTLQDFAINLKAIIQAIRGFNGTPILVTQPDPRVFDEQGHVRPALQERSAVMKEVAAELQTPLIDLNRLSMDLANGLGERGSAFIGSTPGDWIHYSLEGAQVISGLVVNALPDSLGPYLVGILDPQPKP